MIKTYSKFLGILGLFYVGVATADEQLPVLLNYDQQNTIDSVFESNDSIFEVKDIPSAEKQPVSTINTENQTQPLSIENSLQKSGGSKPALPVENLEVKTSFPASDQSSVKQTEITPNNSSVTPLFPAQPKNLDSLDLSESESEIFSILNKDNIEWLGLNNHLKSPDKVRNFYNMLNYQPLWTEDGKVTQIAAQVIRAIADAPKHALRSELYHFDTFSSLQAGQLVSDPAKFDVILSDAFVTYKSHLANGIVNPKRQFAYWNKEATLVDFVTLYLNAKSTGNITDIFTVNDPDYQILQTAYLQEKAKVENTNFIHIPAKILRPGMKGKAVQMLRQRLGLDSSIDIYNEELKQAVKEYQQNNAIKSDGYAGTQTLKLLNRSPQVRLQTLAINMERHRWGYVPNETYLQVNIPAYKMAIRNGKQRLFESNVIVGRKKRPTPIFSDTLETVVLAPYWNVPKTIFKEDKLPKLKKNPNYFGANMQVIDKATGKVVNASNIDWELDSSSYRLRQKPGASNALGRMKFLFPNRHAIYLHDTNNRRLFKRSRRALSSGCIRVERAEELAIFLLEEQNYNRKRIKKESRGREKWLRLYDDKRYPVFLDYYTAWVDGNDVVHYSTDIYGHDKKLKKLYNNALNSQ